MWNSILCIVSAVLLILLFIMPFGCGTSDPLVNPAQTVPSVYVDSTLLPSARQYDWTNYRLGHWEYDPATGWVWIPGYIWSPSQVVWFTGYEYLHTAPLPPPDVVLPRPNEDRSVVQGSFTARTRKFHGTFDDRNLQAILDRIRTHRVAAATREVLRANLSLDFPLTLFTFDNIPPPGPLPAPRFYFAVP